MTPASITVRLSRPDDAAEILQLKDETWLATYPDPAHGVTEDDIRTHIAQVASADRIERWRNYLNSTESLRNWVAFEGTKIAGFVAASKADPCYKIVALYVLPSYQRQGIGSRLLKEALDWLGQDHDVFLEVVKYNTPAIAAYSKAGFAPIEGHETSFKLANGSSMSEIEMIRPATSKVAA